MTYVAQGALEISLEAGADLSDEQFKFVKISGGKLVPITAATDIPAGVLQDAGVVSGRMAPIVIVGPTKLRSAGAIVAGNPIGPAADGEADPKIAGTDTTEYVAGVALEDVSTDGLYFTGFVNCITPHRAS